jgi:predicted transposase YbfD/YdcC
MTIHNQIDYVLCMCCHEGNEARRALKHFAEEERLEAVNQAKAEKAAERKRRYNLPENVSKRAAARLQRKLLKREESRKRLEESIKLIREMFKGMF